MSVGRKPDQQSYVLVQVKGGQGDVEDEQEQGGGEVVSSLARGGGSRGGRGARVEGVHSIVHSTAREAPSARFQGPSPITFFFTK